MLLNWLDSFESMVLNHKVHSTSQVRYGEEQLPVSESHVGAIPLCLSGLSFMWKLFPCWTLGVKEGHGVHLCAQGEILIFTCSLRIVSSLRHTVFQSHACSLECSISPFITWVDSSRTTISIFRHMWKMTALLVPASTCPIELHIRVQAPNRAAGIFFKCFKWSSLKRWLFWHLEAVDLGSSSNLGVYSCVCGYWKMLHGWFN